MPFPQSVLLKKRDIYPHLDALKHTLSEVIKNDR